MKKIAIFILVVNSLLYGTQVKKYYVKPGDSLTGIAVKHNTTIEKLLELNSIENPDLIQVGREIILEKEEKPLEKKEDSREYNWIYIVKKGDNLNKISKKFNIPFDELVRINEIQNPDLIHIGKKLKVKSDLGDLGKKYEKIGDSIWTSDKIGLKYRMFKSLNSYEIANQLYKKSEVKYGETIDRKISKIKYLKEAMRLENLGNINYINENKEEAIENYKEMLENLDKYKKLDGKIEKSFLTKIEKIEEILLKEGEKYEGKNS